MYLNNNKIIKKKEKERGIKKWLRALKPEQAAELPGGLAGDTALLPPLPVSDSVGERSVQASACLTSSRLTLTPLA